MTSPKVALIETKPSRTNFKQEFEGAFDFDQFQLCSDPSIKKVLKRDCDIDIARNSDSKSNKQSYYLQFH